LRGEWKKTDYISISRTGHAASWRIRGVRAWQRPSEAGFGFKRPLKAPARFGDAVPLPEDGE
jgi:hypothetical protein